MNMPVRDIKRTGLRTAVLVCSIHVLTYIHTCEYIQTNMNKPASTQDAKKLSLYTDIHVHLLIT